MKPVGILIVSTGNFATSVLALTQSLLGKAPHVKAVALRRGDHWDDALAKVKKVVASLDHGKGVLVLADIAGGTPFNVAQSLRAERDVEVIGGINIPLVLKAVQVSGEMELADAAIYLERYGRDHITRGDPRRTGDFGGR